MVFIYFALGGLAVSEAQKKKNQAALDKERVVVMDRVKNSIVSKLEAASPYNLFLTTVTGSKMTHHEKLSLSFIGELSKIAVIWKSSVFSS